MTQTATEAITGAIDQVNFDAGSDYGQRYATVTFRVPLDSRWCLGDYKIEFIPQASKDSET